METCLNNNIPYNNLNPHYRGRVRTGCLSCRSKKKRCDEQHPRCKRCVQSNGECVYKTNAGHHAAGNLSGRERELSSQDRVRQNSSLKNNTHDVLPYSLGQTGLGTLSGSNLKECLHVLPFSPHDSNILLPGIQELAQAQERSLTDSGTLPLMISQDIHLCTSIDWLAAKESLQTPSFSYFLHHVELPMVTPFDSVNWASWKSYAVDLAIHHTSIATAISALQLLFKAQSNSLPTVYAVAQYKLAKKMLEATLQDDTSDFGNTLLNVFLITVFSTVILDDTDCILKQPSGPFIEKLEAWSLSELRSSMVSRIAAWLKIMHTTARRGGNQGIMSLRVSELLSDQDKEMSSLSFPIPSGSIPIPTLESASASIFRFYLNLQSLSLRVTNLSHYHRPRTRGIDQEEVFGIMASLKAEMHTLWESRPALMRCESGKIHAQYDFATAESLISQISIAMAAYYMEQVEMGRSLNDPLTPETKEAMTRIRDLIESDRVASCKESLNPAYLRPLFMCAIETEDSDSTEWAVDRMRDIKNPICRSEFFASFAQSLAKAQRIKERRVTARWFCYQEYGVMPPYL